MKLISLHVENFAGLNDFSISFDSDLSIFYEENGFGKSTLAAFVMAMFYGLSGYRKRSLNENEYKRYYPWQGGVFGGKIVFEYAGNVYILRRFFADKQDADEIEVRDYYTNKLVNQFGYEIGKEIFGIDKKSFERTIYLAQNMLSTKSTDDISAKIGNLADDTSDMNNFESAVGDIDRMLNSMNPNRATGSIYKRREEIKNLERRILSEKTLKEEIKNNEKKLSDKATVRSVSGKKNVLLIPAVIMLITGVLLTVINVTIGMALCAISIILFFVKQQSEVYEVIDDDVVRNKSDILNLKKELAQLQQEKEYLEELRRIQSVEEKKYFYLTITKEKLKEAKEQITSKYQKPVMDGFIKYYSAVSDEGITDFKMDADTTLFVEKYGKLREIEMLSKGYGDLANFCLRIAYIDAMYQDEIPFIIMDDPFVNLDDEKIKRANELINRISEKYQIIYFTCSKSRM